MCNKRLQNDRGSDYPRIVMPGRLVGHGRLDNHSQKKANPFELASIFTFTGSRQNGISSSISSKLGAFLAGAAAREALDGAEDGMLPPYSASPPDDEDAF